MKKQDMSTGEKIRPELLDALSQLLNEGICLKRLSNRELVFKVMHSPSADDPAVTEMMTRLWPDWDEAECPPDCWACKQEMSRG